jgi:hypothetical protein
MDFFVYLHRRASNGKVFYVGKGTRYRHKVTIGRSLHWQNIVKKHGYTIEIVERGMQEWWAFEVEKNLILKYQSHGLCNRTDGGEGASGCIVTDETKEKHRRIRNTLEWRKNISQKAIERFLNPEYKKAHGARQRELMQRPEIKEKQRAATLRQFSSQEAREQARQNTIKQFLDPRAVAIAKQKALARYNTPEKRAAHAQAKAVICLDNGMVFGATTLAAEWLSTQRSAKSDNSQIAKACRGIIRTAYGYRWSYLI